MNNQNGDNQTPLAQEKKPLEAEIVEEESSWSSGQGRGAYRPGGRQFFSRTVTFAQIDNTGCMAAFLTCFIFCTCLFQWGLLSAIGFLVFHTIGNVISSVYSARRLIQGLTYKIWTLRILNWVISFFITAWLSGGFK